MRYAFGVISLAALLLAGCSGRSASTAPMLPTPSQPANNVITVGFNDAGVDLTTVKAVGIRLTGETGITDSRYGFVIGYFKGKTSFTSQIVTLPSNTSVKFFNVDSSLPHTISFLGDASMNNAPWPASFNGSSVKSPAGTAIGTANFSSGPLAAGAKSAVYTTGMPGFYMEGCAFHYNSHMMRTVIIVK